MKTRFEEARNMVEAMAVNYHDETLALDDMEFRGLDEMVISGERVELQKSAQRLFANKLRVPLSYLERCSIDLQTENLNYWLEQEKRQRDSLFCRFDSRSLRAVFTDRYKALDNTDVLRKMGAYGFEAATEMHLTLDANMMVVKVPDYSRAFEVNTDKMVPGIAVSNSEVGVLAFSIEAYFYRLVCTNGLISKTQVASKFRHVSLKALEEFNGILSQVVHESQFNQSNLAISAGVEVENPLATIGSFNRRFLLSKKEGEAVERAWQFESGQTMFNVINAYTRGAQERELSNEEANKLERVGGQILSLVKR